MTLADIGVLLVGPGFHDSQALTDRLRRWGFRCHFANSVHMAHELITSVRVDLVLSNTQLPDGTGFGLIATLFGRPVTAFLCLPVENSCLWLPAIDRGKDCLGLPALWPSEFVSALEEMTGRLAAGSWIS